MPEEKKEEQARESPAASSGATGKGTGETKEPSAKSVHSAPAVSSVSSGDPWSGELVDALRKTFPDVPMEAFTFRGENYLLLSRENLLPAANHLKSECGFNMLTDLTAVDYPKKEKRFEVIYQLYSFSRNERLRLKVALGEDEAIESVTSVWAGADWLEREAFDMFGIRFEHHPNLRRILLPEEWQGHPLRKDYSILQQDTQWVQENLHIESGQ